MSLPRWCSRDSSNNILIDSSKIRCHLQQHQINDKIFLNAVIKGVTPSSKIYPLIYDDPFFEKRSLAFLKSCSDEDLKDISARLAIRDLFLASYFGLTTFEDNALLVNVVNRIDKIDEISHQIDNLTITFHPTISHKAMRFVKSEFLPKNLSDFFVDFGDDCKFKLAFVDPSELSYHNFENILDFDSTILKDVKLEEFGQQLTLISSSCSDDLSIFKHYFDPYCDRTNYRNFISTLKNFDKLEMWNAPFNKNQRGGKRFIFGSPRLAQILENCLRTSNTFLKNNNNFVAVNHVFRMNKFEPCDSPFKKHIDTPYYDPNTNIYSKYTMLIYLTEGYNDDPCILEFKKGPITEEETFVTTGTVIIFKQSLKHAGYPYQEGTKLFLRTELLFRMKNTVKNPWITNYFNRAVYLTKQSIFQPELDQWANNCYEISNKLHYHLTTPQTQSPLLKKTITLCGVRFQFLTNGCDYYFPLTAHNDSENYVKDISLIASLDFTNALITLNDGSVSIEKFSQTEIIGAKSLDDIWECVLSIGKNQEKNFVHYRDSKNLKQIGELQKKSYQINPNAAIYECQYDCDGHIDDDPKECKEIVLHYQKRYKSMLKQISSVPFVFLGQKIIMNDKMIKIDERFVYISSSDKKMKPINFAGCVSGVSYPDEYIETEKSFPSISLLIPPIEYNVHKNGYKITIHMFRPGWCKPEAKFGKNINVPSII